MYGARCLVDFVGTCVDLLARRAVRLFGSDEVIVRNNDEGGGCG